MKVYGLLEGQGMIWPEPQDLECCSDMASACGLGHIIPAVQTLALGQSIHLHCTWIYHRLQNVTGLLYTLLHAMTGNEPWHDKSNKISVHPAKTRISLGICPVWSEPLMCAQWVAMALRGLHADSEDSDQTGQMPRLICLRWTHSHFVGFVISRLKCPHGKKAFSSSVIKGNNTSIQNTQIAKYKKKNPDNLSLMCQTDPDLKR